MNVKEAKTWIWPSNILRGTIVGLLVGPVITLFANAIFALTIINANNPILILLIPVGAFFTRWIYNKMGNAYSEATGIAIKNITECEDNPRRQNLATSQIPEAIGPTMGLLAFINTSITHLLGASGGKEGAGVQIGLSVASIVERIEEKIHSKNILHNPHGDYYLMCGATAAFAALFNAPIAGILFGTQFASPKTTRLDAYLPCTISAFLAVLTSQALHIHTLEIPVITALEFTIPNIAIVISLAIFIGFFSRFFCFLLEKFKKMTKRLTKKNGNIFQTVGIPSILLVIILILNYAATGTFEYNGLGSQLLYNAFFGEVSNYAFLIKLATILLTLAACFAGGEVVPLLVLGGTISATIASIFSLPVAPIVALGSLAMLSGGTNLPIVCFALGLELFGYSEPKLLFLACAFSFIASGTSGIYHNQKNRY